MPSVEVQEGLSGVMDIFVAPSRKVDDDVVLGAELRRFGEGQSHRVSGFERGKNTFAPAQPAESFERVFVSYGYVASATQIMKMRVLRTHARVVEPS